MAPPKGFKNNPNGRPKGSQNKSTLDIREIIDRVVTDKDWDAMWEAMTVKARNGDDRCFKLILEYRYGKPAQEITTPENRPIQMSHTHTASETLLNLAEKFADR